MLPVDDITEVASLSWGRALESPIFYLMVNIFAFCAMITSFWAISESFLTNVVDKFHLNGGNDRKFRLPLLMIIVAPPFLLAFLGLVDFVNAIYYAGTFGGLIMSVLPVFILNKARRQGDKEPVWACGFMAIRGVQVFMVLVFCGTAFYTILGIAGILPAGW